MYCYPRSYEMVLRSNLVELTVDTAIDIEDFKLHAKIDGDDEDTIIATYIEAATKQAENYTRRAIRESSWISVTDRFYYCIALDVAPVDASSIVVKYFDSSNAEQTLSSGQYTIKDFGPDEHLQIVFDGQSLPQVYDRWDAVKIEFDAGYADIPGPIVGWIMQRAASMYENRQDQIISSTVNSVYGFAPLFPYKML
jgi:uncharacterized phiE125 gp8 family phage protein